MPITLSKIASNSAHVSFEYEEEIVNIDYYPGKITDETLAQLESFSRLQGFAGNATLDGVTEGLNSFNRMIVSLIKNWDVLEDDGTTFPLDAKRLREIPIGFKSLVFQAIMSDMRPNPNATQIAA